MFYLWLIYSLTRNLFGKYRIVLFLYLYHYEAPNLHSLNQSDDWCSFEWKYQIESKLNIRTNETYAPILWFCSSTSNYNIALNPPDFPDFCSGQTHRIIHVHINNRFIIVTSSSTECLSPAYSTDIVIIKYNIAYLSLDVILPT